MSYGGILGKSTTTWTNDQILSTATAGLYGLGTDALPTQALAAIPSKINTGWKKIQEYTTAGAISWTAPDLFDGKPYTIGVFIIGAGGGGGCLIKDMNSYTFCTGGTSGRSKSFLMQVTPNTQYNGIVGAKGAAFTVPAYDSAIAENKGKNGVNGGSTSFNGKTADGGGGGIVSYSSGASSDKTVFQGGGQQSIAVYDEDYISKKIFPNPFGGIIMPVSSGDHAGYSGDILSCFNPFELSRLLGAGGAVSLSEARSGSTSYDIAYPGGKDPETGLGGGNSTITVGAGPSKPAESATSPGCGGGSTGGNIYPMTTGAGADGAIYIYALGA